MADPPIRWTSKGTSHHKDEAHIQFEGTKEAIEALERCINGHSWFRFDGQEFETVPAHEQVPMIPDPQVEECWPVRPEDKQLRFKYDVHSHKGFSGNGRDPNIYIQHICGYAGPEQYEVRAQRLLAVGFEVLRSPRRGDDAQLWEIWYLPGAWAAKGPMEKADTKEIISWICRRICPGQIMIEGKMYGLAVED